MARQALVVGRLLRGLDVVVEGQIGRQLHVRFLEAVKRLEATARFAKDQDHPHIAEQVLHCFDERLASVEVLRCRFEAVALGATSAKEPLALIDRRRLTAVE